MAVERKRRGGSLGYRFSLHGKCYKEYGYPDRRAAKEAEEVKRIELKQNPPLPPTALINVISAHLIELAKEGKSEHRTEGLRLCLGKHALPFLGESKLITEITFKDVKNLVLKMKDQ